jgi:vacuolar-type H+-ATPase subunit I/STV1
MFGDAGHGIIMLLSALFLVTREKWLASKKIKDEVGSAYISNNEYMQI